MQLSVGWSESDRCSVRGARPRSTVRTKCFLPLASEAGQVRGLLLDGDQVDDDLDGVDRRGLGSPSGRSGSGCWDTGDLPGARALDLGRRRDPGTGPRQGLP